MLSNELNCRLSMNFEAWATVPIVGFVSLVSPLILRRVLIRMRVFDVPNERSSHSKPTVRGAGISTLLGFIIGTLWLLITSDDPVGTNTFLVLGVSIFLGLVGFAEDVRGLKISVRASLQLLSGLVIGFYLWQQFNTSLLILPFIAFIFAFHVNLTNFMDGINGISSIYGFVAGGIFVIAGFTYSMTWLLLVGSIISIAFVTFLPWNLIPPGMFLGDVGSYLLGASIGATALVALADGVHPLVIFAAVGVYWADTVFTLLRRIVAKAPIFKAHRTHVYQRLTDTGLSHLQVATIIALFTMGLGIISFMVVIAYLSWIGGLLLILVGLIFYLFLPKLRGA